MSELKSKNNDKNIVWACANMLDGISSLLTAKRIFEEIQEDMMLTSVCKNALMEMEPEEVLLEISARLRNYVIGE